MSKPAKAYLCEKGYQVSQDDAYAVYRISQAKRLANASYNDLRSMLAPLYRLQTESEKRSRETLERNHEGFAKFQAKMLTEFCQTGKFDSIEKLKDAVAYHWGQLMVLNGWVGEDCYAALDAKALVGRPYGDGKGTNVAMWPPRD